MIIHKEFSVNRFLSWRYSCLFLSNVAMLPSFVGSKGFKSGTWGSGAPGEKAKDDGQEQQKQEGSKKQNAKKNNLSFFLFFFFLLEDELLPHCRNLTLTSSWVVLVWIFRFSRRTSNCHLPKNGCLLLTLFHLSVFNVLCPLLKKKKKRFFVFFPMPSLKKKFVCLRFRFGQGLEQFGSLFQRY